MRVELEGLGKCYGRIRALRDVSVELESGASSALVGPNGSGKSTLIRALMGLINHEGRIRFDGEGRRKADVGRRMAYVPQVAPQLDATVQELVRAVQRVRDLPQTRLERVADALALPLSTVLRQHFRELSGGMRQKVLLMLGLGSDADLFVLDEPTASLDAETRERFLELCGERLPGATVILCSHRVEELRQLVTRVLALREGRLVADEDVADYLGGEEAGLVEILASRNGHDGWLRRQGFRPAVGGWWVKRVDPRNKVRTVQQVADELGSGLRNVVMRDLERIDARSAGADAGEEHADGGWQAAEESEHG